MIRLALALFIVVMTASPAAAQAPPSRCGEHAVIQNTINRHQENLRHRGVSSSGKYMVEVYFDSRDGSKQGFTVTITQAENNISCIVFSGYGWTDYRLRKGGS